MDFKIGDRVKIVSLTDTEKKFHLDLFGEMEKCLNEVFTVKNIVGDRTFFEENIFLWSKYDLVLFNNTILEIE